MICSLFILLHTLGNKFFVFKVSSLVLVLLVLAIYITFADLSVLS